MNKNSFEPARGSLPFAEYFRRGFSGMMGWLTEARFRRSDLLVLAAYGVIVGFGIWHHEPWSDEALPWMIARDTDLRGFFEIIFHNWDRHPGLFHSILIPFTKLGFPYLTQAVLNGFFALATAFLFMAKAPFPRIFRVLFIFSFYMLYEYSVITRPYMLAILLLFSIAAFYPERNKRPFTYAALIALLLHSDYIVFGLASGLIGAFIFENKNEIRKNRKLWPPLGIMILSAALAFWMGRFLPVNHHEYGQKLLFSLQNITQPVSNAFFPFANQVVYARIISPAALWGGGLVILLVFLSLKRSVAAVLVLGGSLSYLFFVFAFLHKGDYRHHGFVLLSLIFALWIFKDPSGGAQAQGLAPGKINLRAVAIGLMGLFFILGSQNVWFVYQQEYFLPFSGAREMAGAIRQLEEKHRVFENDFVIVAKHKKSVGLMPYLPGVKFWNPCAGNDAPLFKSTKTIGACDKMSPYDAVQKTRAHFGGLSKILFLSEKPLSVQEDEAYKYRRVYVAGAGVFGYMYETFYLYRAEPKALGGFPLATEPQKN